MLLIYGRNVGADMQLGQEKFVSTLKFCTNERADLMHFTVIRKHDSAYNNFVA